MSASRPNLSLNLLNKQLCEADFYFFIKMAWSIVDSAIFDESAWHLKLLANYFQALYEDKIPTNNLLINIPPRFGKSRVSALFACWVWAKDPTKCFLYSGYGKELAEKNTKLIRKVITSKWYMSNWYIRLTENRQDLLHNSVDGEIFAVGCGGAITGFGGDYLIADDILKADNSHSTVEIENANVWYAETWSSRYKNIQTVKYIVIGQRLAVKDITGFLLDSQPDGWEQIILPLEYDGKRYISSIGLDDPRKEIGESLWPSRYTQKEIDNEKGKQTELGYACQFEQRASTIQGNIFRKDWFTNRVDNNDVIARFISVDPALIDKKTADNSSIVVGEINSKYQLFVRYVFAEKLNFPDLQKNLEDIATRYRSKLSGIIIESKASGLPLQQSMQKGSPEWMKDLIIPFNPTNQKEDRFMQVTIWCEKGMILLPPPTENYPWLFDFEAEFFNVPQTRHDDRTDALAQLIMYCENYLDEGLRAKQKGAIRWD